MNLATITALPTVEERPRNAISKAIFQGRNGVRSALLSFGFFVMMAAFYFANGWTPRLLEQAGGTAAQGINAGILLNLGGAAAALLFGVFAIFVKNRLLTIISFVGAAAAFLTMGLAFGSFGLTLLLAVAVGVLVQACATGLFTLAPECYTAAARTTGVGWAVSVGRVGAIISPILAGVLIDSGWTAPSLYMLFAFPLLLGGLAIVALRLPARADADSNATAPDAGAATSAEPTSPTVRS